MVSAVNAVLTRPLQPTCSVFSPRITSPEKYVRMSLRTTAYLPSWTLGSPRRTCGVREYHTARRPYLISCHGPSRSHDKYESTNGIAAFVNLWYL